MLKVHQSIRYLSGLERRSSLQTDLLDPQQKLLEAFDFDNIACVLRFGAWRYVDVDDLTRIVNAGRCKAPESTFKLRCSATQR